jgi:hypothetical protein
MRSAKASEAELVRAVGEADATAEAFVRRR